MPGNGDFKASMKILVIFSEGPVRQFQHAMPGRSIVRLPGAG
jgi:hypothetical protein